MEQESSGFNLRHFLGLFSGFMFLLSIINLFQFGNLGDPVTFTFLKVATVPILIVDLLVVATIYCLTEHFRELVQKKYLKWIPISILLVTSALYITGSFNCILRMLKYNEEYKDTHEGIECYECNVLISRLNIGIMSQSVIAVAWFIYVRRHHPKYA